MGPAGDDALNHSLIVDAQHSMQPSMEQSQHVGAQQLRSVPAGHVDAWSVRCGLQALQKQQDRGAQQLCRASRLLLLLALLRTRPLASVPRGAVALIPRRFQARHIGGVLYDVPGKACEVLQAEHAWRGPGARSVACPGARPGLTACDSCMVSRTLVLANWPS